MSSFVCWAGVDSHGPASVYFASDSRITWPGPSTWDRGVKVFASRVHPLILGYVGDALFPSHFLGQFLNIVEAAHSDNLPPEDDLLTLFVRSAQEAHGVYPSQLRRGTTLAIAARYGRGSASHFRVGHATFHDGIWEGEWFPLPSSSGVVAQLGSGAESVTTWLARWGSSSQGGTSRSVFSAFCDSLRSGEDPHTGGAPQLVGLYRIEGGRTFGVLYDDDLFVAGAPVDIAAPNLRLEWRNRYFERVDPSTGERLTRAQPHHVPKGLGG